MEVKTIIELGCITGIIYHSSTKGLYNLIIDRHTKDEIPIHFYDLTFKQASDLYFESLHRKVA